MMMDEKMKMIEDKINFFMDEKVEIHVVLQDRTFLNGFIEKKLKDGVYWFQDHKLKGVYLFLKDIWSVDKFTEARG